MNLRAFVSNDIGDEVEWVVIESDEGDTKGYFVYYYRNENMAFDTWHASLENAFDAVWIQYGIDRKDWEVLSD
ncbi:hypothetical protein [Chitinophaga cymbidii]|uniref:Uncharacterized protein n=1 Tax=Chitinophaga cymbidii TaxID=1096750 RepID=A0A512RDP3_9BACT|nr:hypothetical protein [Chitinophaga cymbidii]GEP93826.1 hypothetical protein CCY01nite_00860 [Chitinophaga cymbidii]